MVRRSVPASIRWVAKLWRSVCGPIRFLIPARCGFFAGVPNRLVRDWSLLTAVSFRAGEQIYFRSLPSPVLAQGFEQLRCHRHVAIPGTLSLVDMDQHAFAVDVADFEQ